MIDACSAPVGLSVAATTRPVWKPPACPASRIGMFLRLWLSPSPFSDVNITSDSSSSDPPPRPGVRLSAPEQVHEPPHLELLDVITT